MIPEEREELLAAYALGTLPSREAATVEALVRSDSAAARSLASYHEIVDMVALSVPLRRADPALRTHVLAAARAGTPTRAPWSASRIAAFVAASAASMLLVVWGVNLQRGLAQQREKKSECPDHGGSWVSHNVRRGRRHPSTVPSWSD